jgi:hypothetical protein
LINTIEAYRRTEQGTDENEQDWIYGNSRDGRSTEIMIASSPIASPIGSPGPANVTIIIPSTGPSHGPSPDLLPVLEELMEGEDTDLDLYLYSSDD